MQLGIVLDFVLTHLQLLIYRFRIMKTHANHVLSERTPQFEIGEDGKPRLRGGWKKIDLSKITRQELEALGIDPNLSAKEIAKKLKVRILLSSSFLFHCL